MINGEVLEALLSPDAERRRQAEAFLESMAPHKRMHGLMSVLLVAATATTSSGQQQQQFQHYRQLAAVLLRRDILKSTDAKFLQDAVLPRLLRAFVSSSASSSPPPSANNVATAIGNCLAEICAVLSWSSSQQQHADDDDNNAMRQILQSVAGAVRTLLTK